MGQLDAGSSSWLIVAEAWVKLLILSPAFQKTLFWEIKSLPLIQIRLPKSDNIRYTKRSRYEFG
jgi:hypothetical protein